MKPKFQVGDRVRIREDIPCRGCGPDGVYCNDDMHAHHGMEFEISSVYSAGKRYRYYLADPSHSFRQTWIWEESFFESAITSVPIDTSSLL